MNTRLNRSQVLMIGCAFVLDSTLISKPSLVIRDLQSDFWQGLLLGLLYGAAATIAFAALASRFPRKDFFEGIVDGSPILGRFVVAGYVLFFLGILVRDIRSTTDFVKVSLLTVTPLSVIAALLGFCLIFVARHGKHSVARMSQLWQPMLVIVLLLLPFFLATSLSGEALLPVLQHRPQDVWLGGSHIFAYTGEVVGIFMIATYRTWSLRYSLYSLLLGWGLLLVLTFSVVMSLGIEIPARTFYPNYEVIRKIRLTDFLDRLDLPIVGIWLPAMIVKTSFSLYIAANGVTRIYSKLRLQGIAMVLGATATAAAVFAFGNSLQIFVFDRYWTPISAFFQLGLPAALLLFVRKRKKPPTESSAVQAEQESSSY
ncbi:MAG TPA: endospore germination permease [Paenibacillus sp.]|nr:endospore germination permease [Paenibacillus sp.]